VGPWLASLTAIAAAFAYGIACAVVGQSAISRILFAMARDRLLPYALARVHPKTHQPHIATLFTGIVSLFVALGFQNRVDDIVLFQNFGALNAFVFVNLAVIGYFWFKQKSQRLFSHVVLPICGILAILYLLRSMRWATLMLGGAWVLAGLLYYVWITRVLGRRVALQT
jgi:amino acid transporter